MAYIKVDYVQGRRICQPGVPFSYNTDGPACTCSPQRERVKVPGQLDEVRYEHVDDCEAACEAVIEHGWEREP